mgnify:CR=1 FL=1
MKKTIIKRLAVALFIITPLAACGSSSEPAAEHGEEGEPAKGPHNGRLLKDGDFAVEMTIFEDGVPPQFRVYPTRDGKPVDAKTVQLRDVATGAVTTERYDKLVLSPGAVTIRPPLPGIDLPGIFEVTYLRPDVLLDPIRIRRELSPSAEAFGPGGLPDARVPIMPELPLRFGR